MRYFKIGRLGIVVQWCGWRGCLARYRWGILGREWPTIYAGPFKFMTGPSGED